MIQLPKWTESYIIFSKCIIQTSNALSELWQHDGCGHEDNIEKIDIVIIIYMYSKQHVYYITFTHTVPNFITY